MKIISNFESSMSKYLDARQSWTSLATLQANTTILMPDGFRAYCQQEHAWYKLAATDASDPSTYNWTLADVSTDDLQEQMQFTTLPEASSTLAGKIYQYIGASNATYTRGRFYNVTSNEGVYQWTEVEVQDAGQTIQYATLPDAATTPLGTIVQYIGSTTGSLNTGYFYENEVINYSVQFPAGETPSVSVADQYTLERCGLGADTVIAYELSGDTGVWKNGDNDVDLATYGLAVIPGATLADGDYFTIVYNSASTQIDWINRPVQPAVSGGGGGSTPAIFNDSFTPTIAVPGTGITPLHTWPAGNTLEGFLRDAFAPPIEPDYTITLTPAAGLKIAGQSITNPVITVSVSNFKSAIPAYCNLVVYRYNGTETTGGVKIGEQAATTTGDYTFTDNSVISTTVRYEATMEYCFVEGTMLSKTIGTYYTMTSPSYSGDTSVLPSNLTGSDVVALSNQFLSENAAFEAINVTFTNKRYCYAFPTDKGVIVKVTDTNGFDVTSAFQTESVTINTVLYTVWIMTDTASITSGAFTFFT